MALTINYAALDAYLESLIEPRVERFTDAFQEKLSHEGSGLLHVGNLNRSSTPDEYPAEQTQALRDSIGYEHTGPLAYASGSFESKDAEGYKHGEQLENIPISKGGRRWLEKAYHDPELQAELLK